MRDLESKGFLVSEVNDLPNLDLPKWGYYKHINGRTVYLPADKVSRIRNKNKGFVYLGEQKPGEPL